MVCTTHLSFERLCGWLTARSASFGPHEDLSVVSRDIEPHLRSRDCLIIWGDGSDLVVRSRSLSSPSRTDQLASSQSLGLDPESFSNLFYPNFDPVLREICGRGGDANLHLGLNNTLAHLFTSTFFLFHLNHSLLSTDIPQAPPPSPLRPLKHEAALGNLSRRSAHPSDVSSSDAHSSSGIPSPHYTTLKPRTGQSASPCSRSYP